MGAIYLKHERHGTKVACSEAEAKHDESHGWVRYVLQTPLQELPKVIPITQERVKRKYTKRV